MRRRFPSLVGNLPDPAIVTRNGRESFAVMTVEELDVLRLEAARARLYRDMDEAEGDFARGRMTEAVEPRLARMGHRNTCS